MASDGKTPAAIRPPPANLAPDIPLGVTPQHADPAGETSLLDAVSESTSGLKASVDKLIVENEGLANEVLRGYEQLNLIFEFTQHIAPLTHPDEIEEALLVKLGELLHSELVYATAADGQRRQPRRLRGDADFERTAAALEARIAEPIRRARQTRQLVIESSQGGQVLVGPIPRLDQRVDVVIALQGAGGKAITSGEMLIVESFLAFGSQIISNSELHARIGRMSIEVTRALVAAIDKKDHYTSGHSERVGFFARLTGEQMKLPPAELQTLEWAGLLHDVGKIGIPEEILNKPDKLTPQEWELIKKHPEMGYEILEPIASFESVLGAVMHHHENADGSGYPQGLAGDDVPFFARIIHVVDVFDALSTNRSYRNAFSPDRACQIVREEAGTKLDRAVAQAFLTALETLRDSRPREFEHLLASARESGNASN